MLQLVHFVKDIRTGTQSNTAIVQMEAKGQQGNLKWCCLTSSVVLCVLLVFIWG